MNANSKFVMLLGLIFLIMAFIGIGGFFFIQNLNGASSSPSSDQLNLNAPIRNLVNSNGGANVSNNQNRNQPFQPPVTNSSVNTEAELIALARSFSERYGSYSTNNAFQNLRDLKLFMTDRLWNVSEKLMASGSSSTGYFGVTSRALQVERLEDSSDDVAKYQVTLQRTESKAQIAPRVYYQITNLQIRKASGSWLVDEFQWGKEL